MHRKEREVTELSRIEEIIRKCDCCRVGLLDGKKPYIVPMNFGCESEKGAFTFYFHGAGEGKKIDLIRKNPQAGFELDTSHELCGGENACEYTFCYQSVIGNGEITFVTSKEEKIRGLQSIMRQYTHRQEWEMQERMVEKICILKLEVKEIFGKEHRKVFTDEEGAKGRIQEAEREKSH